MARAARALAGRYTASRAAREGLYWFSKQLTKICQTSISVRARLKIRTVVPPGRAQRKPQGYAGLTRLKSKIAPLFNCKAAVHLPNQVLTCSNQSPSRAPRAATRGFSAATSGGRARRTRRALVRAKSRARRVCNHLVIGKRRAHPLMHMIQALFFHEIFTFVNKYQTENNFWKHQLPISL